MKTILTKTLAGGAAVLFMMSACKKNDKLVVNSGSTSSQLTASVTTLVLDKSRLNDTSSAIKFTITAPSYNFKAVVSNAIQIDAAGDNWQNPTSVALSSKGSNQSYSTADFNALLLKLNLPAGKTSQINVRVQNALSNNVATYSNVVSLTVTPFNLTSYIYVVGQFNGYSTTAPDSLVSLTSNGIYTGIINFTTGNNQFLILPAKNFNNKYATTESPNTASASLTYSTEYVSMGGNNLVAPAAAGNYLITLNINTNTIAITAVNAFSAIGTVTPGGNFTGDDDLKYINDGTNTWSAVLPFTYGTFPGGFKVRQNHDWKYSWGTIAAADGVSLTDNNGGNIPVAASGNYKFTFTIPVSANSILNPTVIPPVSATYTLTKQ